MGAATEQNVIQATLTGVRTTSFMSFVQKKGGLDLSSPLSEPDAVSVILYFQCICIDVGGQKKHQKFSAPGHGKTYFLAFESAIRQLLHDFDHSISTKSESAFVKEPIVTPLPERGSMGTHTGKMYHLVKLKPHKGAEVSASHACGETALLLALFAYYGQKYDHLVVFDGLKESA